VQQISAEAKRCLDLVKKELYVEAIEPCRRAVQDAGNADVERAYDEAKAAVQQEAQAAAVKAAAESLSGKPAGEAAEDAASDVLRKFGAEAP
jgi:F0F1-type ATP synthase membrane subunit b/b'